MKKHTSPKRRELKPRIAELEADLLCDQLTRERDEARSRVTELQVVIAAHEAMNHDDEEQMREACEEWKASGHAAGFAACIAGVKEWARLHLTGTSSPNEADLTEMEEWVRALKPQGGNDGTCARCQAEVATQEQADAFAATGDGPDLCYAPYGGEHAETDEYSEDWGARAIEAETQLAARDTRIAELETELKLLRELEAAVLAMTPPGRRKDEDPFWYAVVYSYRRDNPLVTRLFAAIAACRAGKAAPGEVDLDGGR